MRVLGRIEIFLLASALFFPALARGQNASFKEIDAQVSEYRRLLDREGVRGTRFWIRLDSTKRPHRLYVGEGFLQANAEQKEEFIDTFSHFLAGHPDKFMLIDIFDAKTGKAIGEYGFGGFRLF